MESLKCDRCSESFNQTDRSEVVANCGHTFCLDCFQEMVPTQENNLTCPKDQEIFQFSSAFKARILKRVNQGPYRIVCDHHPLKYVKCYCSKCEKLFCSLCGIVNHKDHVNSISEITAEEIGRFCTALSEELVSLRNKIEASIQIVGQIIEKAKTLTGSSFKEVTIEALNYILPFFTNQEQKDKLKLKYTQIQPQQEEDVKKQITGLEQSTVANMQMGPQEQLLIQEWLGNRNFKLQLLYRGTRDGFTANLFHEKLKRQGATLHLIKSQYNRVFGGYRSAFYPDNHAYNYDKNAFIFSITDKRKLKQISYPDYAIHSSSDYLTAFGSGADIYIEDKANQNQESYSYLGNTYEIPNGWQQGSGEANNYLAGAYYFKVLELEVYKVIY